MFSQHFSRWYMSYQNHPRKIVARGGKCFVPCISHVALYLNTVPVNYPTQIFKKYSLQRKIEDRCTLALQFPLHLSGRVNKSLSTPHLWRKIYTSVWNNTRVLLSCWTQDSPANIVVGPMCFFVSLLPEGKPSILMLSTTVVSL